MENSNRKPGWIKRVWQWWRRPSRLALGTLLLIGFVGGIIFWGGFNTGMEKANTEEFCISCHEMRNTVYQNTWKPYTTTTAVVCEQLALIATSRMSGARK